MATDFYSLVNNGQSKSAVDALNNTTDPVTFSVTSGTGSRFPTTGNPFFVTVWDSASYGDPADDPNMEILLVPSRTGDEFTGCTRAQQGTTAVAHSGTPAVRALWTYGHYQQMTQAINTLESNVLTWTEVTGTSQAAAVTKGYICNNAALVTVTLPATASVGAVVRIIGKGAGGWQLAQNAGQTVQFGTKASTTGTGGYLASINQYDAVTVVCTTADSGWTVASSQGNITVI